ncbi:MAG TPA: acyl carrier protein [Jatrophihabitans sp.]|nr:acyl carrier protein [Jatrophihabitans sp.]
MTTEEIERWLVGFVASLLDVPPQLIAATMPFDSLGVDSATTLVMAADLSEWLRVELSPVEVFEFATIRSLAERLAAVVPVGG